MAQFTVIDLASQARAVARYTRGWKRDDLLSWLRQFGELEKVEVSPGGHDQYHFRSPAGLWVTFRYTDEGEFFIFGDHTCWLVEVE
jgi:hypothetical protein